MNKSKSIQFLLFCITTLPILLLYQNCSPPSGVNPNREVKSLTGGTTITDPSEDSEKEPTTRSSECILFGDCGGATPLCPGSSEKFSILSVPNFESSGVVTRIGKLEVDTESSIEPSIEKSFAREVSLYARKEMKDDEYLDVTFEHLNQEGDILESKIKRYIISKGTDCENSSPEGSTPIFNDTPISTNDGRPKSFVKNAPCNDYKKGDLINFNGTQYTIENIFIENVNYPWLDLGNDFGETCQGPYTGTDATIVENNDGSCSNDTAVFNHNDPCSQFSQGQKICYLGKETTIKNIINPSSDYPYIEFDTPINEERGKSCKRNP